MLAFASALGVFAGCAAHAPSRTSDAPSRAQPYVVLVSLDAYRRDYLDRFRVPALDRLAAEGIRARALVPPFPSKTFPSHYSIVTGLYPGHHGILANNFYEAAADRWFRVKDAAAIRDGRWFGGEPIWVTAEREGVRTAVYFWPGSEANVLGVRPTYWKPYRASVPDSQRVDESIAWLRLAPAARPHLLLLYLSDVDDTTHKYGPDTPHTDVAVRSIDRALRRLFDSLQALPQRDSTDVIVLSDHGMAASPQTQAIAIRPLLAADGIDTTRVLAGDNGPSMSLWFDGDDELRRRTLASLRTRLVHARAYARGETPPAWHLDGNRRAGDVIVVGDVGYVIVKSATDRFGDLGTHGWDPAVGEMHGIFLAAGPQVRRAGLIPAFDNVHVQPFIAALLGLRNAPRTDGDRRVLAPYLRRPGVD